MNWSFELETWWAGALLGAAAVVVFTWHARRSRAGRPLLALRGLGLLCLVLAVLQGTLVERRPQRLKPRLLVLLDHGHAMQAAAGRTTRLAAGLSWLRAARGGVEEKAEPVFYALSDRGRRLRGWSEAAGLAGSNASFHPSDALRDAAEDPEAEAAPPERAWLLTDGNGDPDPELEAAVAGLKVPVDVIAVGPSRRGRGLSFVELKAPDFAFLHGRFSVEASWAASAMAGQEVVLRLLKENAGGQGWTLVDSRSARLASDFETLSASFTATAQSLGSERYRLEAACVSLPAHAREFRVEVIRQKYRIMYLAGRPSAEYANLREFLKSDPSHELVSFVILRNPENPSFVGDQELSLIPFPAEEIFVQSLKQFDLFILENFSYARFHLPPAYLNSLKGFVSAGGALLVMGGENAFGLGGYRGTPLEEMLPVTLSARQPDFLAGLFSPQAVSLSHPLARLYDSVEESQAAWAGVPPLDGYGLFASVRAGSTVLAVHPKARTEAGEPLPVLALRGYGRGKVMLVSSDSTWRWRLGAAADLKTATFYSRFWTRSVQYLTGSLDLSKVKFAPLPDRMPAREPAALSLRVFDEGFHPAAAAQTELTVLWTGPGGGTREVAARETEPGIYSVELTGLKPGPQRLRAVARYQGKPWGEDAVRFQWEVSAGEQPIDRRFLRRVADASGGSVTDLAAADSDALLAKLSPARTVSQVSRRRRPWASPFWLALTASLLLSEWALRRWKGHS